MFDWLRSSAIDALMSGMIRWLAEQVDALLGGLIAFMTATVFTSPDVTVFPQVETIAGRSSFVVSTGFVLAIIVAGAVAMTHSSVQTQYGVKELLPRLVFGFVVSHFGAQLTQLLIVTANALTTAMVGESTAAGPEVIDFVQVRIVAAQGDVSTAVPAVVLGLLIIVLMFMLLASWLVRIGVLIVLAAIAPVALACYCLPYTQGAAQLWWRTLLACLATPVLQAVSFTTGVNLLLDPQANLPVLIGMQGLPSVDLFNLFVVVCLLWLTARIPKLMGRFVTHRGSVSTAGVVLRAVFIQSVTRRLPVSRRR